MKSREITRTVQWLIDSETFADNRWTGWFKYLYVFAFDNQMQGPSKCGKSMGLNQFLNQEKLHGQRNS